MPLAPLGLLDLSTVTDVLTGLLTDCVQNSPVLNQNHFTINISGLAPDAARELSDCQLSLYLFHVDQDKFQRNLQPGTPIPPNTMPVVYQPLALNLYYLLTAYSKGDYHQEQQAMSVAIRCLYEHPIVKTNVLLGGQNVPNEFSLTMEVESNDELSRLWQATTVALRLSVAYKVSVVLISPDATDTRPAPKPQYIGLSLDPTNLPYVDAGQVLGSYRTVEYQSADSTIAQHDPRKFDLSPATVAAGQTVFLYGAGFDKSTAQQVFLLMPPDFLTEYEVTAWKTASPLTQTSSRFALALPGNVGIPPGNPPATFTPPAGIYQLRVGRTAAPAYRSNSTPFSIAARVDAAIPPIFSGPGPFTMNGAGFITGATEVLLDTIQLKSTGGIPPAGFFNVGGGGASITFTPPTALASGRYAVRVRVNQVECDPAWWFEVP
jgi:uncharacterized protein DUF4255